MTSHLPDDEGREGVRREAQRIAALADAANLAADENWDWGDTALWSVTGDDNGTAEDTEGVVVDHCPCCEQPDRIPHVEVRALIQEVPNMVRLIAALIAALDPSGPVQ